MRVGNRMSTVHVHFSPPNLNIGHEVYLKLWPNNSHSAATILKPVFVPGKWEDFLYCVQFLAWRFQKIVTFFENHWLDHHLKVQVPATVKFLAKITEVVESSHVKYFWNQIFRFLVIKNLRRLSSGVREGDSNFAKSVYALKSVCTLRIPQNFLRKIFLSWEICSQFKKISECFS